MNVESLITDEQMNEAFQNTNFGSVPRRVVLAETLLKCACGFGSGYTATTIAMELGLVVQNKWELTTAGKFYLYNAYNSANT